HLEPDALRWADRDLVDLVPVAELRVRGLRARHRRPGIGAPLAARAVANDLDQKISDRLGTDARTPVTVLLRIDDAQRQWSEPVLQASLELYSDASQSTVTIDGRAVPLEVESTAALAWTLSQAPQWRLERRAFFFGDLRRQELPTKLIFAQPFRPGRIPVVFVHGTASSVGRWADMLNHLLNDTPVLDRFQFWFFTFPSGSPIAYSAMLLRDALTEAVGQLDPEGADRALHEMVLDRGLGGCAASHIEGTRPARTFCAILTSRPWVVVTVPALVLCSRWLGWSRELATTSLVTGPVLIPFGRLHVVPSLPPPRLSFLCVLLLEAVMTPHKDYFLEPPPAPTPTLPPSPVLSEALQLCHPHAAGIDIGEAEHWVAVPPGCDPQPVRRFGTFTADLDALADWLIDCGVTTVAMESTGVYWIPLFELLEARGFQVLLIDPRQAKRVPGRPKTDRLDCKWLQRLHTYGLLAGAFRPEAHVCVLRSYLRHRQMLLTYAAHHIQHMHKALEQMNLKLTQVVSDITGVTGMAILKAILAGERDPQRLAKLRNPHCHHDEEDIAKALQGTWRAEHLFALRQAVELYAFYHQQMTQCDQQIQAHL